MAGNVDTLISLIRQKAHEKYSADQPRDPAGTPTGGQWTSGENASGAIGPTQSGATGQESADLFEQQLLGEIETERFAVFGPSGELLFTKDGETSAVEFDWEEVQAFRNKQAIATHNHPSGASFSPADVIFAREALLAEIRVIDPVNGNVYTMRPVKWDRGFEGIMLPRWPDQKRISTVANPIHQRIQGRIGSAVGAGALSIAEANRRHWDMVWKEAAPQLGLIYERSN